jgi:hypothetical protein
LKNICASCKRDIWDASSTDGWISYRFFSFTNNVANILSTLNECFWARVPLSWMFLIYESTVGCW